MNTLIPCLRYEDAPAAIDFLCRAFGLTRRVVYADPHNPAIIHHAELTLGDSMVMLGSARPAAASAPYTWRTPREAGGVTSVICAIIDDPTPTPPWRVTPAPPSSPRRTTTPAFPAAPTTRATPRETSGASPTTTPSPVP